MNAIKAKYQIKNNKNLNSSQYKMLRKLELSKDFHKKIIKYCKKKKNQYSHYLQLLMMKV